MIERADADAVLLTAVDARDQAAFEQFYDKHADAIARFAWTLTNRSDYAQELVQDTFTTAWTKPMGIHLVNDSALPWLITTCRHHAQNLRRRERQWASTLPLETDSLERHAETGADELLEWILQTVAAMTDIDKSVCELCMFGGVSYREAAKTLGISEASVGKRLHRARRLLKKEVHS